MGHRLHPEAWLTVGAGVALPVACIRNCSSVPKQAGEHAALMTMMGHLSHCLASRSGVGTLTGQPPAAQRSHWAEAAPCLHGCLWTLQRTVTAWAAVFAEALPP